MAKPKTPPAQPSTADEGKTAYPPFVAFAVVPVGALFQPCRLHIEGNEVHVEPLHDALPYEALAYEYLQGDVLQHYETLQIKRSIPCRTGQKH